jgi:GT2 family glycosyltransferase
MGAARHGLLSDTGPGGRELPTLAWIRTPVNPGARPLPLTDGRFAIPGNRWDLLEHSASPEVRVAVVIPYYEQPAQLALVLRALELQDFPSERIEVVVADDGSPTPPDVSRSRLHVTVVRQDDEGFRAAAARNLGAAATTAEVLCFLDADTVPEPDYLRELTRLPALVPDAISIGRRRHADLTDWPPDMLAGWWGGRRKPPILPEPGWLTEAYVASHDLLQADHGSYRYVISAVMCCSRELFHDIGGFDESFREYGGEDWEFAHRAIVGGAVLQHCPRAVAWHDGPDWADRAIADRASTKNREALAMARLIPDPAARRPGLRYDIPNACVEIDVGTHRAGSLITTIGCLLHEDVGIWLSGPRAPALLDELGIEDQRVRMGPVPEFIERRCRFRVSTSGRPALPPSSFTDLLRRCAEPGVGEVRCRGTTSGLKIEASWAANRRRRWSHGRVRFRQSSDATGVAAVVTVSADTARLRTVDADADLSW